MLVSVLIISLLIIYAFKGFKEGALVGIVNFAGVVLVALAAFTLKTPISEILYTHLPFFDFNGIFKGLTILNIVIYELIAFCILASVLMILYTVILRTTKIIDRLIKATLILELPLKIIGIAVGFVEGVVVVFTILFVLLQINSTREYIENNDTAQNVLKNTPVLSEKSKPLSNSVNEIYEVAESYKDNTNKNEANLKSLDILLKYKVLNPNTAKGLVVSGKLNIDGADALIDKYIDNKSIT